MNSFGETQKILRYVMDMEHQYIATGDRLSKIYTPWIPFQCGEFLSFMYEIVAEIPGDKFMDVGCGPGTKMLLAQEMFGLTPYGIEIDKHMAQRASVLHPHHVIQGDVMKYATAWDDYDLIWLYRPLRDAEMELKLEHTIMNGMKPGAVLAGGQWEIDRPRHWITVIDDWENGKRGAWMKPAL